MTVMQRVSTIYIAGEDRLRLSAELENTAPVVIWLTQRLLQRLLPVLLAWLEARSSAESVTTAAVSSDVLLSFSQGAARAELQHQEAVKIDVVSAVWLAESVEITRTDQTVSLTFCDAGSQCANLTLAVQALQQWLSILYDCYSQAEWNTAGWPEWVRASNSPKTQGVVVLH